MSIGLDFILRAKTEFFTKGMATVNNSLKDVKKSIREFDVGSGLKQALGVGGIIAAFRGAIVAAQELRDTMDEVGRPVDASTRSVAELGDALGKVGGIATKAVGFLIGGFTQLGGVLGSVINRIRGISEAEENVAEQIARDADKAEKRRDEAYKNAKSIIAKRQADEKRASEEKAKADEKRLEEEFEALEKVAAAEKKLDEAKAKSAYEQLDLGKKITSDEEKAAALALKIAEYKQHATLSTNDQLRVTELETELLETNDNLYKNRLELAEKTKKTEEQIKKELEAQKNALASIQGIRGGSQFNQASDESLSEIVRRNRSKASMLKNSAFGAANIGTDMEAARLEAEAINAERELKFRQNIRRDFSLGGESRARQNFQGDPLQFDRVFDQIVKGQDTAEKSYDTLVDIKDALTRKGIVTLPIVKNGTGGG